MQLPEGTRKQLEASAAKVLPHIVGSMRDDLIRLAERISPDVSITKEAIELAYEEYFRRSLRDDPVGDAQAIVSRALRENRMIEWASYGMAILLFVFGLFLLTLGAVHSDVGTRVGALAGGSITELLILIPFRFAINSRKHNIALRMLAYILNSVQDPTQLAPLIRDTFNVVVLGKAQEAGTKSRRSPR